MSKVLRFKFLVFNLFDVHGIEFEVKVMGVDIAELKEKITPIAQKYGVKSVYLFGSRARGDATNESDYDFFIHKGKIIGLQLMSFERALENVLGCNVDVVTTGVHSERLMKSVERDGVLLYEN
ncbi:MAG: nucleotidyltransferase domain-containing protein [Acidaminococcaceae bacterium]|nr:nucleotidyltransferase domain-containing protein [Acidaminococcaceae bacterium]